MGCRCAERRQAISRAVKAAVRGDRATLTREIAFIGQSTFEDTSKALAGRLVQQRLAHLRSMRR